jgi:hypothetical protein
MTRNAQTSAQVAGMLAALAVLFLAAPAPALAQSPGSAAKPNTTIPEKQHMGPVHPPGVMSSSGVIVPKADTDPGITKKPPPQDPKEMPVIQPPKGAGGEPDAGAR